MGKFNIFVHLNAYKDSAPSNNPALNNFKWSREITGVEANKAQSVEICLAPNESRTIFNSERVLSNDNTTEFGLSLKSGTTNTYVLKYEAGTFPDFRTSRYIAIDATTEVTVSVSNGYTTIQSTGGTLFNLSSVLIGDEISLGPAFNASNQGRFKVLSKTADAVVIENSSAVNEGPIVLGSDFDEDVRIYSAAGVQVEDKVRLSSGFSTLVQDTYEITGVQDNLIEFYSSKTLPPESPIVGPTLDIYASAKKLVYLETDKKISLEVNGVVESSLEPFIDGNASTPGVFLKRSTMWSLVITNTSTDMATLYIASIE